MPNADADDVTEGLEVHGADGISLGAVSQVYRDDDTGRQEWAVVGGHFVPLRDVRYDTDGLHVGYTQEQLDTSPHADPEAGSLTRAQEAELFLHYGIDYDVTTLIQTQTGGEHGGASGEDLGEDFAPADPDHLVRRGVVDEGVTPRDQTDSLSVDPTAGGGEQVSGTGTGGTIMGTARYVPPETEL